MSAKKNYFYSVICEIITTAIPFVTLPYLSRTLGAEGVGEYVYAFTWAYYFMLAARLGVRMYGNRTVARLRDDREQLSKAFSEIYTMQLCVCAFTLALYLLFCRIWFIDNTLFLVLMIYMASTCFEIDWFYYGLEKIKITAVRTVSVNLLTAVSIFTFVRTSRDIWIYALINSAGAIAGQLSLFVGLKKYIRWEKPAFQNVFRHLMPNLLLFAPTIATSIYRDMNKLMLGWLGNYTQLGLYENANKLQTCFLTLITSLSAVMLPRISNLVAKGEDGAVRKYLRISNRFVLFLSSAIAFGIGGIATEFAPLFFGGAFAYSGWLMMWLTPTIIFVCFSGAIRSQYIIPYGKDKIYLYTVAAGAVVNFALNYLLIPYIGAFGSVIGTIFAELTVVVTQYFCLRNDIPYKKLLAPNLFFIACGAGMFLLTRMIAACGTGGYPTVIMQIVCGGVFYLTGSFVYLKFTGDDILIPQFEHLLTKGKKLLKKTVAVFLFVFLTMTFLDRPVLVSANQAVETEYHKTQKIVSVVYDDSGSMSENGIDSWSEVNYSMQLFSGMLSDRDKLYISYMSDKTIARPIALTGDRQAIADEIKGHFEKSSTPLATVETAYQALVTAPAQDEDAEYWLVIFTDGGFQVSGGAGEAYARQKFNELIDQYSEALMPNGASLNIVYLAMGEQAYELKNTEPANITAFRCDGNKIIETMAEMSYMVMNKYHFENNSGFIKFVSKNVIELTTPLPLFDVTVIAQNKNAQVAKISRADAGDELSLYSCVKAKYPVQSGYKSNTALTGSLANGKYKNQFMPAGTYRIEFDAPYDKSGLSVFGSLAVEIRITNTHQNTADVIEDLSDVYDDLMIDSTAAPYICQTGQAADLGLLHEELRYSFGYSVNNKLRKSTPDQEMRLTGLQLEAEPSALEAKIVLGNSGYLRTTLTYQPKKFYVYQLSAVDDGPLTLSRNKLNRNSKGVRFCVYKNGNKITDAHELMKLRIDFSLQNKGFLTGVDVEYTRDGDMICTPKFSSDHIVFGTLTNWLSAYVCPAGENAVAGTFHTAYSDDDVTGTAGLNIKRESIPVYIFHLSVPFLVLLIALGYVFKPRFKKDAKIKFIFCKYEGRLLKSHLYRWQEIPLRGGMNAWSFIPFAGSRAAVNKITFKAMGVKHPRIGAQRKSLPENSYLIKMPGEVRTYEGVVFHSNHAKIKNSSGIKGNLELSCNQGLLVPEDDDLWAIYMAAHSEKRDKRGVL